MKTVTRVTLAGDRAQAECSSTSGAGVPRAGAFRPSTSRQAITSRTRVIPTRIAVSMIWKSQNRSAGWYPNGYTARFSPPTGPDTWMSEGTQPLAATPGSSVITGSW